MISNVEYYFICLWPVIFPIQRSVYLGPFPFFKIGLFVFVVLRCINSLYILEINSLLGVSLVNMFSHKVGSHFILLMVSFAVQKFLVWYSPTCLFFSFVSFALGGISAKILLHEMSEILLLFFFFWYTLIVLWISRFFLLITEQLLYASIIINFTFKL